MEELVEGRMGGRKEGRENANFLVSSARGKPVCSTLISDCHPALVLPCVPRELFDGLSVVRRGGWVCGRVFGRIISAITRMEIVRPPRLTALVAVMIHACVMKWRNTLK